MHIEIHDIATDRSWTDKLTGTLKTRKVQTAYLFPNDSVRFPTAFDVSPPPEGYRPGVYTFVPASFAVERGKLGFSFSCPLERTGDL